MVSRTLEVHEHRFVKGKFSGCGAYDAAGRWKNCVVHSHPGGDKPHSHPDTGPACYTIDRDAWRKATGLRGGGRKKFTARPSGEQLALVPAEEHELSFRLVVCDPTPKGPGDSLPQRIMQTFGMSCEVVDGRMSMGSDE